jgi:hypothetical protein
MDGKIKHTGGLLAFVVKRNIVAMRPVQFARPNQNPDAVKIRKIGEQVVAKTERVCNKSVDISTPTCTKR